MAKVLSIGLFIKDEHFPSPILSVTAVNVHIAYRV